MRAIQLRVTPLAVTATFILALSPVPSASADSPDPFALLLTMVNPDNLHDAPCVDVDGGGDVNGGGMSLQGATCGSRGGTSKGGVSCHPQDQTTNCRYGALSSPNKYTIYYCASETTCTTDHEVQMWTKPPLDGGVLLWCAGVDGGRVAYTCTALWNNINDLSVLKSSSCNNNRIFTPAVSCSDVSYPSTPQGSSWAYARN